MFVAINNIEKNIFEVDKWINTTRDANGGIISPEFAMEILSKTNHLGHIKKVLKAVKKGRGGVNIAHHKNTAGMRVIRIPTPPFVQIAMKQGIGAECTPVVKVGDYVKLGQLIGDSDAYISAPIYSSISDNVNPSCNAIFIPFATVLAHFFIKLNTKFNNFKTIFSK